MPHDDPDPTDPLLLVGVELPGDEEQSLESCRVIAEEFARLGFDEPRLLALFRDPFYAAPHRVYQALGEASVRAVVREEVAIWGRIAFRDRDAEPAPGFRSLPVLEAGGGARHGNERDRAAGPKEGRP